MQGSNDETSDFVKKFETVLKENESRNPVDIYSGIRQQNTRDTNKRLKPEEVIANISKQIKAIQKADCIKEKCVSKNLIKYKKSAFLPVNKLPRDGEVLQQNINTNQFDTQCVSNTQLIKIIEDAEAMANAHKGITQEFNTSFYESIDCNNVGGTSNSETYKEMDKHIDKQDKEGIDDEKIQRDNMEDDPQSYEMGDNTEKESEFVVIDISLKVPDTCKESLTLDSLVIDRQIDDKGEFESDTCITENDAYTQFEYTDQQAIADLDMPSSPIFNIKPTIRKSRTPSPLVFDLNIFEKFEKIAVPLVEDNLDFEMAKHMINSQILGRELLIQTNFEPIFREDDNQISPVIPISKDKLKIGNSPEILHGLTIEVHCKPKDSQNSNMLKDEILFSSDEDDEYVHKNLQELPFTCALETSFYDQPSILNKTMYVGFQTASNKSIQIDTNSFSRAKSIFDNINKSTTGKEPTFTELVETCDDERGLNIVELSEGELQNKELLHPGNNNFINVTESMKVNNSLEHIEFATSNRKPIDISEDGFTNSKTIKGMNIDLFSGESTHEFFKKCKDVMQISNFEGFRTASNKEIKLSDIALARSTELFQDIDSNNFHNENKNTKSIGKKLSQVIDEQYAHSIKISENRKDLRTRETMEPNIDDTLLHEFDCVDMIQNNIVKESDLADFEIVSENDINVSDALVKTGKLIQDINFTIEESSKVCKEFLSSRSNLGFKTASNKSIKISDHAMENTRNLFHDIDSDNYGVTTASKSDMQNFIPGNEEKTFTDHVALNLSSTSKASLIGFHTANNKKIGISKAALIKTESIFKDIEQGDNIGFYETKKAKHTQNVKRIENIDKAYKDHTFIGFQTASNRKVNVSDEALSHTKKIFKEFDISENITETDLRSIQIKNQKRLDVTKSDSFLAINQQVDISKEALGESRNILKVIDNYKNTTVVKEMTTFQGFQTASNKPVKISEELLAKSRIIFKDIDNCHTNAVVSSENSSFKGFKTASNIDVRISEEVLAKSRKIFKDVDSLNKNMETENFKGFQTASNKLVRISEEALSKSRNTFKDIDNYENTTAAKEITSFQGFRTASNKPVKISEELLAKSKNIFKDIDNYSEDAVVSSESTSFKGFKTAGNRHVRISDEAIAKTRKMFKDADSLNENLETENFKGFKTASNKLVRMSEGVMLKSSSIFRDIDISNGSMDVIKETPFKGFQTANNKNIKISGEALVKSRNVFKNIDNYNGNKALVNETNSLKGFQTANNKEVKVSEQALAKKRKLFQDHNENLDTNENNLISTGNEKIPEVGISSNTEPHALEFKTANKHIVKISEDLLQNLIDLHENSKIVSKDLSTKPVPKTVPKNNINVENIINTQVLNNFEQTMYTEDFCKETTPKKSKRSGSPILSCPKAKRRKKFETPYSQRQVIKNDNTPKNRNTNLKPENVFAFNNGYKKNKTHHLKDVERLEREVLNIKNDIDPYVMQFNFDRLLQFAFFGTRNDVTGTHWSTNDLKTNFLGSVNRKFVPDGWFENHYKLILWKLISYEIKFPNTIGVVCTARNVIEQLKYRYDRELYNAERPALRKIMEKDDTSSRTLILCVVSLFEDGANVTSISNPNNIELLLTDGWYCIRACTDKMLAQLVKDGRIVVGSKIATNGAELVNCQGVAPWEDTSAVRLKLSGNSTRRARWNARLGYHGNAAILSHLSSVRADGGKVSRLRAFVTRVYQSLYVEKFDDGSTVTRSERLEHLHQMRYETERQAVLEKLYEEVEKEFSDQDSQDSDFEPDVKRPCLDSGSQIAKVMKTSKDPMEFRSHLTEAQSVLLRDYTTKRRERLLQDIQRRVEEKIAKSDLNVNRNVVPLMKIRVAGFDERNGAGVTRAMLSVWKPTDAITDLIKEGTWIEILNVIPTAVRYSELQISAGRQSVFSLSKHKESEKVKSISMKRNCYTIKDLTKNPAMTTDYNEIDVVGLIFLIDPPICSFDSDKHQFQNVYLADADKNIICANFWGGLKKFGFENVLDTGQIVTCTNLQKRAGNTRKNIPQYRVTEFSYFTKTPKHERARAITDDLNDKLSDINRAKFCIDCVNLKNNYAAMKLQGNNENLSPYRFQNTDINLSKNKIFIDAPLMHKNNKIDDNLNLTGLDFESTFKQTDTQELSPKTLLRKRQLNEKIAKLKMYGEPPPLSPIQILNKSKNAGNAYKSPLISKSDVSPHSVASEWKIPPKVQETSLDNNGIDCSPIIMNKTYVKRTSVNPVKLNFGNSVAMDESTSDIDHFAEEFDGSPPLSLD